MPVITEHMKWRKPRNKLTNPISETESSQQISSINCKSTISSFLSTFSNNTTSNETTHSNNNNNNRNKKNNNFSAASTLRGLGCTAGATQEVSVPAVIRSSADWQGKKNRKKKHRKNKNNKSVVVDDVPFNDVWCGPGIGFSTTDVAAVVESADCFVARKNLSSRGKFDGERITHRETLQMEEKSIMHYRSTHKILLVGEGDFSFSLCLARAFGIAFNMVSTSLDSRVSLGQKYSHALINVTALEVLGCTIFHEMDVYTMKDDPRLKHKKFDRIIYNFPHVGFICAENTDYQIRLNKKLVSGFLRNAKHMLNINGEIHITHKTTHPFTDWDIKELASQEDLDFVEEVIFRKMFYPGYYNKRGSGSRCNQNFPIRKSSTFKFTALEEAQVNYEQEESEEEYLSKGLKVWAKQNRVRPKWLGGLLQLGSRLCGLVSVLAGIIFCVIVSTVMFLLICH